MASPFASPLVVPLHGREPLYVREWDTMLIGIIIIAVLFWIFCSCGDDNSYNPYSSRYYYERFRERFFTDPITGQVLNKPRPGGGYDRRVSGNALMAVRDDPGSVYQPYEPAFGQVNGRGNPAIAGAVPSGSAVPSTAAAISNLPLASATASTTGAERYTVAQGKQDAQNAFNNAKKWVHNKTAERYTVNDASNAASSLASKGQQYLNAAKNWVNDKVGGNTKQRYQPVRQRYTPRPAPQPLSAPQTPEDAAESDSFRKIHDRRPQSTFQGKSSVEFFGDFENVDQIDKITDDTPETAQPELTEDQLLTYIGI